MTLLAVVFTIVSVLLLLVLPREFAPLPFLAAACYITLGQGIEVAGLNLYILRILIFVGLLRLIARGEWNRDGWSKVDTSMVFWSVAAVAGGIYQRNLTYFLGLIFNMVGFYALFRTFIRNLEDAQRVVLMTGVLLIPVALFMAVEKKTGHNAFAVFGGVPEISQVREGSIRAQGPFRHPILAGTAAGAAIPLVIALWGRRRRTTVICALAACLVMVVACASSGPIITVAAAGFGLVMWKYQKYLPRVIVLILLSLIGLEMVMKAHVWYLLARFDLAGGSTGWWRAELITQAGLHLKEWWLLGTTHTAHWMPVSYGDDEQTDITNEYIQMGVWGGLPLMLCFIYTMRATFSANRRLFRRLPASSPDRFFVWMMGTTVFAHAVSFVSVSYFDQTIMFWCLITAMIASLECHQAKSPVAEQAIVLESSDEMDEIEVAPEAQSV